MLAGVKKKDSDESDYYEPDEEELEEERQDAAAKLIQGLFRAKRARHILRELVKANFVKEVDSLTGENVYRNRRTGHVSRNKPVFLGNHDLESPRHFALTDGHDPGESSLPQFALFITNRVFESPKIPEIPEQVYGDHDAIREIIEHPYFCKFSSENCFFVKDASLEVLKGTLASFKGQVLATMARLKKESERRTKALRKEQKARALERKRVESTAQGDDEPGIDSPDTSREEENAEEEENFDPQEALLVIYICTHAAEITKGKKVAGTYLVASDTSWTSKEDVARTAVRLETFAEAIADIQVRHKVMFLDVVHTEKKVGGFKTRHLYPPRDLYDTAARLSNAVVVGSCRIGGTREIDTEVLRNEVATAWGTVESKGGDGVAGVGDAGSTGSRSGENSSEPRTRSSARSRGDGMYTDGSTSGEDESARSKSNGTRASGRSSSSSSSISSVVSGSSDDQSRGESESGSEWDEDNRHHRTGKGRKTGRDKDRNGPRSAEGRGPRPRNTTLDGNGGKGVAPTTGQVLGLAGALGQSAVGLVFDRGDDAKASTALEKEASEQYDGGATRACAPVYDRAIYDETMSVFGRSVRDAITGRCAEDVHAPRVLVAHLFAYIARKLSPYERTAIEVAKEEGGASVGEGIARPGRRTAASEAKAKRAAAKEEEKRRSKLGAKAAAEEARKAKDAAELKSAEEEKLRRTQMPVIAGPSIAAIASATVCAAPTPPPPPGVPFATEITRASVRLTWEDPCFSGEPPTCYELEAKGDLRNNGTWTPVFPPWYPTVVAQPLSIPHRIPGLGLRYRVRAGNYGGWGDFSEPTELITTKPWLEDVGRNAAVKAMEALVRTGGPRLVLERMKRYSSSILIQEGGFHQLVGEFNKGGGIPRTSLAQEVATVVADAMAAFSQARTIQGSGLLLIGWAARGKGGGAPLAEDVVKKCQGLVTTAEKLHPMDVTVKSHALWATANLRLAREAGAVVSYRATSEDVWLGTTSLDEETPTL